MSSSPAVFPALDFSSVGESLKEFVLAFKAMLDRGLIPTVPVKPEVEPPLHEYGGKGLTKNAPASGWISESELAGRVQLMTEAIAAEKWEEGFLFAVQIIMLFGGAA